METIKTILTRLKGFLDTPLFNLGEAQITLLSVLYFLLLLFVLVYISGKGKKLGQPSACPARSGFGRSRSNRRHRSLFVAIRRFAGHSSALFEAAKDVYDVLETPAPVVRFIQFGENGLEFELRAWTTTLVHRRGKFTSAINFAIYDKFKEHEIEVPYPQRDIHIRSGTIDLDPGTI